MRPLFTIIFEDGSKFEGGNYIHTKWMDVPQKKIRTLYYSLPTGDYLILNKYENYFHMAEQTTDIMSIEKIKSRLEYDYIMGRRGDKVIVYKIDLFKDIGKVESKIYDIQDKFIKGLNKSIWKQGVI